MNSELNERAELLHQQFHVDPEAYGPSASTTCGVSSFSETLRDEQ